VRNIQEEWRSQACISSCKVQFITCFQKKARLHFVQYSVPPRGSISQTNPLYSSSRFPYTDTVSWPKRAAPSSPRSHPFMYPFYANLLNPPCTPLHCVFSPIAVYTQDFQYPVHHSLRWYSFRLLQIRFSILGVSHSICNLLMCFFLLGQSTVYRVMQKSLDTRYLITEGRI